MAVITTPPHAHPQSPVTVDAARTTVEAVGRVRPVVRHTVWRDYTELSKIRLNGMVLVTTAVGYVLGSGTPLDWSKLALTLLGTGLAAVGASAFNQVLEVRRDGLMERTRDRPLPAGRIKLYQGILFAFLTTFAGVGLLTEFVGPLVAALGMLNVMIYVMLYTPLKPRTSLNTPVGAICGALPPMMGWAAATNELGLGAWILGAILFLWQIPHFLALAWMYRADYARGGFRMLPVIDPTGRLTCPLIILYCIALLPVGLAMSFSGVTGWYYGVVSLLLGLGMLYLGWQMAQQKTYLRARRLFLASVTYLPLLLGVMLLDRNSLLVQGPQGPVFYPYHAAPATVVPVTNPVTPAAGAPDSRFPSTLAMP